MEGFSEVSLCSFSATMSMEESELMAQLLGPYPFSCEQDQDLSLGISSLFWPDSVVDSGSSSQDANSSSCYWPRENYDGSFFAQPSDYQTYYLDESNVVPTIDKNHEEMIFDPSGSFGYRACLNEEMGSEEAGDYSAMNSSEQLAILDEKPQHKRKFSMDEVTMPAENTNSPKKKMQNIAKVPKPKKSYKSNAGGKDEESNFSTAPNVQSSSSCCSEDDSNASQELNGGSTSPSPSPSSKGTATTLNLNGKARASRGSASDPQSLYARKRRERINERLRILQNLVPNGTKVDISTMLEEAVQYVKFLQLQIKLLSSDDLWMYAPLAYNGMDIGLDLKISALQQ